MKELKIKSQDEVVIVDQQQAKKEIKFLGTRYPSPGHKCFELNIKTGEVTLAEFTKQNIQFQQAKDSVAVSKKVITKENCIYTTALNKKNAIKRFKKMLDVNKEK